MIALNLSISEDVKRNIDLVAKRQHIDFAEVIQRALAVYDFLTEKKAAGYLCLIRRASSEAALGEQEVEIK